MVFTNSGRWWQKGEEAVLNRQPDKTLSIFMNKDDKSKTSHNAATTPAVTKTSEARRSSTVRDHPVQSSLW